MQTQTHALIGAYFFGKRDATLMTVGAVAGMAPDLPMFVIVAALRTMGHSGREIFGHDYFQPWWQHINGLAHSLILWPLLLVTALVARRQWRSARWPAILLAAAAAGLAHCCIDFLCHREDAHMQLWPVSTWKFISPLSYYDPRHFGVPVMIFEAILGLFLAWRLFGAARRRWSRGLIVLASFPYVATLVLLSVNGARAEPAAGADGVPLGRFATGASGWSVMRIDPKVAPTRYTLTRKDGVAAIEAHADHSQALFVRDVDVALDQTPILCWRWRVAGVIDRADIHKKSGDDQAARVLVGLSLPRSTLSLGTRMKLALGRTRFGKLLPDGALNYVWDNKAPVGTILPNAFTDRARMFVLQSGNAHAGKWVAERRDLIADMQSQFGTTAGKVMLIALATDTDNTGGVADAAYADLHLVPRGTPCRFQP
ncbi:MAG: DUF3047 domain-containing protein [Sphingomonas sp.]|uniref:DUF3047 domain-containing protein n=1 Tax=Sphingomonas sp. TaxID=28214 RepID=UPI0025F4CFEC|nr:DUF3047 domain-containing protein [Sphingomonas sp.]MBY0285331.1 DUF3047 domain-containing protein [Sphingomonas sp.]